MSVISRCFRAISHLISAESGPVLTFSVCTHNQRIPLLLPALYRQPVPNSCIPFRAPKISLTLLVPAKSLYIEHAHPSLYVDIWHLDSQIAISTFSHDHLVANLGYLYCPKIWACVSFRYTMGFHYATISCREYYCNNYVKCYSLLCCIWCSMSHDCVWMCVSMLKVCRPNFETTVYKLWSDLALSAFMCHEVTGCVG